jgi:hypothetical protein
MLSAANVLLPICIPVPNLEVAKRRAARCRISEKPVLHSLMPSAATQAPLPVTRAVHHRFIDQSIKISAPRPGSSALA